MRGPSAGVVWVFTTRGALGVGLFAVLDCVGAGSEAAAWGRDRSSPQSFDPGRDRLSMDIEGR